MNVALSGLASGFDWQSLVDQLIQAERAPEGRLTSQKTALGQKNTAYGNIVTQLQALQTTVDALKDPSLFGAKTTSVGDSSMVAATAGNQTAAGSYRFTISQLATNSAWNGAGNVGQPLSSSDDVSALVLSQAGFSTAVTDGTFTINNSQITIAGTDTLQQLFDKINTATGGSVKATYDSATDKISLTSADEIVLGSATDSSNFLQVSQLVNNGTGTVASAQPLGTIRQNESLASAHFATPVDDGGAGQGEFTINGVSISYNAGNDTLASVIGRINDSAAGVVASYDSYNDRLVLNSKVTGDMGIAMNDVTGNFLKASGLVGGALVHGKNLLYKVNDGPQLTSSSNTISAASSNIPGLTLSVLNTGSTVVGVAADTGKIQTAITDFVSAYNKVQSLIDTQTASSTDAKGTVTTGTLTGEDEAQEVAWNLRSTVNATMSALTGTIKRLEDLGITSNGNNNQLTAGDATALGDALTNNLADVQKLFSDKTDGLAVALSTFLDRAIGDNGTIITRQNNLTKQSAAIDQQVSDMERLIQADKDRLTNSFVAMEEAQAKTNQELTYLTKTFGGSSSSS